MIFQICNTPTSFKKYINIIFVKKLDVIMTIYFNNILINT